jgi:glutamate N-acetyltransferase / amino-acid N-acetyltransferase
MSLTYPAGFAAAGLSAGLKRSGKPDLGLVVGEPGTTAAGLFTTNRVQAAPVHLSRSRLALGRARAALVNSGQANAATGERGAEDAERATAAAAAGIGLDPEEVLACSTGVIGEPIRMPELLGALPALTASLSVDGGDGFARAILTTDTVPKEASSRTPEFRVGGCAKGVGMIAPNLATMLAFVTTDAAVATADLQRLAVEELGPSFNALTVDGCTSTNDTVLAFASGASPSATAPIVPGTREWDALATSLADVAASLARQLLEDGEGVQHVMQVDVEGAASEKDARLVARAVADSPLVKTAAFGGDPNPGRILQAVGAAGAEVDPTVVDVWIGDAQVVRGGVIPLEYFEGGGLEERARRAMGSAEIEIRVSIGDGSARHRTLGADLSYDYVRINGEYTT